MTYSEVLTSHPDYVQYGICIRPICHKFLHINILYFLFTASSEFDLTLGNFLSLIGSLILFSSK